MDISITSAAESDADAIASIRNAAAARLTEAYGKGHWSSCVTNRAVLRELRESHVLVARSGGATVATFRLSSRKPWAIDTSYFSNVTTAVYLGMAVDPEYQRRGIGRKLVAQAKVVAGHGPSNAIRLDAYDSPAGAGPFYVCCGFREVGRTIYRSVPLIYLELLL